jgi:hypothetical protein
MVLSVAIVYLARHGLRRGFEPFEISLLAAAWLVPLLSRGVAGVTAIPLGLTVLLLTFACTMRRAVGDSRAHRDRKVANANAEIAQA